MRLEQAAHQITLTVTFTLNNINFINHESLTQLIISSELNYEESSEINENAYYGNQN